MATSSTSRRRSAALFQLVVTICSLLFIVSSHALVSAFNTHRPRFTINTHTQPVRNTSSGRAVAAKGAPNAIRTRSVQLMSSSTDVDATGEIISVAELMSYASEQGVTLSLSTLGPGFRGVARAKHDEDQIIGYCEGFIRPGGKILHVDKMEVFKKALTKARTENPQEFKGGGTNLGVGLLIGYLCLLHGKDNGCTTAEFLAIDDEEYQHRRLVRYYRQSGFKVIRYVGEEVKDIPDRLVWGGCGTLMREEIQTLLQLWTSMMNK